MSTQLCRIAWLIAFMGPMLGSSVHAQTMSLQVGGTVAVRNSADLANWLQQEAFEILTTQATRRSRADAGRLFWQAAQMRSPDDSSYVLDAKNAALALMVGEQWREARYATAETAARALRTGDLYRAAYAYMSASILARRLGQGRDANQYARTAARIAEWGAVSPSEHDGIIARIDPRTFVVSGSPEELP